MGVRALGLVAALLLAELGGWLTVEGLGWGSSSGTSREWATVGPILGGLGVALLVVTVRRHSGRP